MTRIDQQLARLETLSPAQLRQEWQQHFVEDPPRLSTDLMRRALGYALQEKVMGELTSRIVRQLRSNGGSATRKLAVGTQLVRSWNGRTISVEVIDDGFLFDGSRYASLSAIAREATGAHWSGPRFFGLIDHGQ